MRRSYRTLPVWSAVALALAAALSGAPLRAQGRPVRILEPAVEAPAGVTSESPELRALLDRVEIGPSVIPHGMDHVRVYPLVPARIRGGSHKDLLADPGYLTLDHAMARGLLRVREKPSPTVPGIELSNHSDRPVLILAGEILVGGKQNRILQSDLLLPPHSGPRDVSAFCVEHGRWTPGEVAFKGAGAMAPAPVRRSAAERDPGAQAKVWESIGALARGAGAADSRTESLHDVMEDPAVESEAAPRIESVKGGLPDDTVGMIAVANGTIYSFDLFCSAPLFSRYREKIVRAAVTGAPDPVFYFKAPGEPDVRWILEAARQARAFIQPSAGIGSRVELDAGRARGEALVAEGRAVHTALFLW